MANTKRPASDGVTGEYISGPSAIPQSRQRGQGLAGIDLADPMQRSEQAAAIHAGELSSIHSWELVTAVDGPGTRLTIFFSGCPLRCLYCHNPDTMEMRRGQMVPTEELIARMLRYKRIFAASGGGITLSGGEPLMQPHAVERILASARENKIHTAIDTSGNLGWRCTDQMLENLDLCLLDIKSGDEDTYRKVTGQSLQPTIDFSQRLAEAAVAVWVRFVLVPGLTSEKANIERVADLAARISTLERVEVLPFHQMGRDKWADLGLKYQLEGVEPPTNAETEAAREIFRSRGITTY